MANRVEEAVEKLAEEILADTDYELVDVEYVKERDWFLRIYIDKDGGVGLDDCQEVSGLLDERIEKLGILNDRFILEVSSPGLDRALKKEKDFQREMGKKVDITLYKPLNGEKNITGVLTGYAGDTITIDEERELPLKDIALVRLHIDF
ncbi:ribosome maturation factor RimP [Megamonas hypermegale]|uniref:Ribosome maturation factor RimP n=1 Tax=Megamonas hypermegale TaxID=158847 RepID=A0A921HLX3_9FIRM|nr:ribosome maturation factor RimP [Megamonas hypermegale]HJF84069.1 ribosome maturation factor RimP [Megamonas hypermegale]